MRGQGESRANVHFRVLTFGRCRLNFVVFERARKLATTCIIHVIKTIIILILYFVLLIGSIASATKDNKTYRIYIKFTIIRTHCNRFTYRADNLVKNKIQYFNIIKAMWSSIFNVEAPHRITILYLSGTIRICQHQDKNLRAAVHLL